MQYLEFGSSENEYLKYDYVNITTSYGSYATNLYYIINKNCRDKNKIKDVIFNRNKNCFKIKDIEKELKKIGYNLNLQKRLVNNINYYYIVKDNTRSKNLYVTTDTKKIDLSDLD